MIRRSPLRLAIVTTAAALAASGCATFTNTDVAARVGDIELTEAELASLVRESVGDDVARAPLEAANTAITGFLLNESLRADLDRLGVEVPEQSSDELTNASLEQAFGLAFQAWQSTPPRPFTQSEWSQFYERGPIQSGITCTAHILVETEFEANDALALLEDGTPFADVAAAISLDEGSEASGAVIPCATTANFANANVGEYVDATLSAEIGVPVGPVQSQFGYHIILVRPFDEIELAELEPLLQEPAVRFELASADLDIYVNPRYGSFEGARGVVPLG